MHTVADLVDDAWKAARAAVGARKRFFEDLRAITTYLVFPTWTALVETLRTDHPTRHPRRMALTLSTLARDPSDQWTANARTLKMRIAVRPPSVHNAKNDRVVREAVKEQRLGAPACTV